MNLSEELTKLQAEQKANENEQERLKISNHFLKKRIKLLQEQIESEKEWQKPASETLLGVAKGLK